MSDPDACPRCNTFWYAHDERECADLAHRDYDRVVQEATQLRAVVAQLRSEIARLRAAARVKDK